MTSRKEGTAEEVVRNQTPPCIPKPLHEEKISRLSPNSLTMEIRELALTTFIITITWKDNYNERNAKSLFFTLPKVQTTSHSYRYPSGPRERNGERRARNIRNKCYVCEKTKILVIVYLLCS